MSLKCPNCSDSLRSASSLYSHIFYKHLQGNYSDRADSAYSLVGDAITESNTSNKEYSRMLDIHERFKPQKSFYGTK